MRSVLTSRPEVQEAGDGFEDDVQKALYASKIIAYAQGFDQITAGSEENDWDVDLGDMATIWRWPPESSPAGWRRFSRSGGKNS